VYIFGVPVTFRKEEKEKKVKKDTQEIKRKVNVLPNFTKTVQFSERS
jgi:hypothetical protein